MHEFRQSNREGPLQFSGVTLHMLPETHEDISATQIRAAAAKQGTGLRKLVPNAVAEYIQKEHLYRRNTQKPLISRRRSS